MTITDTEWEKLNPSNFETASLLRAVDAIDEMRDHLNDRQGGAPPEIRTDLLRLHGLAMAVINEGSRSRARALFDLATDIDERIGLLMDSLVTVQETIEELTRLYPASLLEGE